MSNLKNEYEILAIYPNTKVVSENDKYRFVVHDINAGGRVYLFIDVTFELGPSDKNANELGVIFDGKIMIFRNTFKELSECESDSSSNDLLTKEEITPGVFSRAQNVFYDLMEQIMENLGKVTRMVELSPELVEEMNAMKNAERK